jgi:predicted acyltransferase
MGRVTGNWRQEQSMATLLTEPRIAETPLSRERLTVQPPPAVKPQRLMSLDAYRGFIMLVMASGGLALPGVAKTFAAQFGYHSPTLDFLAFHTDHVPWVGCSFWDLIQPSFMFMVGVALPFSYASRIMRGDSEARIFVHTLWRALILVLLAVFLSSNGRTETDWVFVNVLAQIGLGYPLVFLLLNRGWRVQLGALAVILAGYWLYFYLWPLPPADFNYKSVDPKENLPFLTGWFQHWDKNTNAAHWFDVWFLNLFPRSKPFEYNAGGYQTLNFVPSMATMILGLMAGELLRRPLKPRQHFSTLVAAGLVCLALGLAAGEFVCPIVKRIWTPSWALYSSGWTFLMLAGFYWVIDMQGWRRWAFPFVVVGMNSIAMYCMAQLMKGWVDASLRTNLGQKWFEFGGVLFDPVFGPIVQWSAVLLVLWFICLWMYRRGVFLRV